jgi:hypothetical protein
MAETIQPPINGNYNAHQAQAYGVPDAYGQASQMAQPNTTSTAPTQSVAPTSATTTNTSSEGNNDISKDEVGWYFVEQYYTTLSRSPEKLHVS